jgi:hypothetical protein
VFQRAWRAFYSGCRREGPGNHSFHEHRGVSASLCGAPVRHRLVVVVFVIPEWMKYNIKEHGHPHEIFASPRFTSEALARAKSKARNGETRVGVVISAGD